ncbi:SpoU rRNA methylase family protein [Balneicella halophila]|uniref:SpoU rRNA methylase family protein n=1 Tax=Balneicella halophila TaxID=1537566 RepID=A0A7L4UPZ5_BALHA|nr:RNA methyltransferase [Balneicella halophila]PVX51739.1 SpoU rRNA methylase family protein [Balneicella halophila]
MRKLKNNEMKRLSAEEYKLAEKLPVVVILDNVRSLNNIGSVFRTADALRIEKIYLCGITATPPHRDIHKTALGAEDAVPWKYVESTEEALEVLKSDGYKLLAIEQTESSTMLHQFQVKRDERLAIVFGNEVKGVQQEVVDCCEQCIEIPQEGTKHSLNISVSAGMVLWEFYRQFRK